MQDQKTATLTTTFSEVLANLAFMFTDQAHGFESVGLENVPPPGDVWLETTIGYSGPAAGTLRLQCTRKFSIQLAANLLGADPKDADVEQKAYDAVKEFMNIVCGQFITAAHGTEAVFDLTIPHITVLAEAPHWGDEPGSCSSTLAIDGQLTRLSYTEPQASACAAVRAG